MKPPFLHGPLLRLILLANLYLGLSLPLQAAAPVLDPT